MVGEDRSVKPAPKKIYVILFEDDAHVVWTTKKAALENLKAIKDGEWAHSPHLSEYVLVPEKIERAKKP
jgi:hypothetical protein